jgi:hypothetical protein
MYRRVGEGELRGRPVRTGRPSVRITLPRSVSKEGAGAAELATLEAGSKAAATVPTAE